MKAKQKAAKSAKEEMPVVRSAAEVVMAADRYEAFAVELSQAVMGVVDRNEHKAQERVDAALDELRKAVRAWRHCKHYHPG